ncbi:hypothetical protein F5144DRAFT_489147 [Chaetomium tenue]|uniref:Uncharacterized protein n=1 Tax=Chaetomium tenue TaxID=1854479 RepID=A0ACB7P4U1_9PEZI|nr:hypothetical protein F5144DRAFT_489147 [Chaetomium globosum]
MAADKLQKQRVSRRVRTPVGGRGITDCAARRWPEGALVDECCIPVKLACCTCVCIDKPRSTTGTRVPDLCPPLGELRPCNSTCRALDRGAGKQCEWLSAVKRGV